MAMDDEETVALIAGGHTFGKTHGAGPATHVGPSTPEGRFDSKRRAWAGRAPTAAASGADCITSGLEVRWSQTPVQWSNHYFENLFKFEWEKTKSPAGAIQWVAKGADAIVPDPHDPAKKRLPTMLTTDLSLRFDPAYEKISRRFRDNPAGLRRSLRARLVQAHPPRHGPEGALPRPGSAEGRPDLAGPAARRRRCRR